jgi:hypothetical protein
MGAADGNLQAKRANTASDPLTYEDFFGSLRDAPENQPYVIGQLGQSLDGRIATVTGQSRDINNSCALDHLHRLRAHVDAVLVGAGTVLADDPQLNVRRASGPSPARVVLDPRGRTQGQQRWLADDGVRRIVISGVERPRPAGCDELIVLGGPTSARRFSRVVCAGCSWKAARTRLRIFCRPRRSTVCMCSLLRSSSGQASRASICRRSAT